MFFVVQLAISTIQQERLKLVFKEFAANIIDVMIVNIIVCIVIWISLITEGFVSLIMFVILAAFTFGILKTLMNSNSAFTPKFLRITKRGLNKIHDMISE